MAIPTAAQSTGLTQPNQRIQFVDANGFLTSPAQLLLQQIINYVNGGNRVVPVSAGGTTTLTLTPNSTSPSLTKYVDYEQFIFVATATGIGADPVVASVVPSSGVLATLPVYHEDGTTAVITSEIVSGTLYVLYYSSNASGFILK